MKYLFTLRNFLGLIFTNVPEKRLSLGVFWSKEKTTKRFSKYLLSRITFIYLGLNFAASAV